MKRLLLVAVLLAVTPISLLAQETEPGRVDVSGSWRLRAEDWSWFDTPARETDYSFFGSLLTVNAGQKRETVDWLVEGAMPILWSLPENAVAPPPQGLLGLGANYDQANRDSTEGLFVRQAFVNFKGLGNGRTVKLGRFIFSEGMERSYDDANLMWLKRMRISQRLIGDFGFSHVGRSFDGAKYAHETGTSNFTLMAAVPTEGVFDVDGNDQIDDIFLAYGAYTRETATPGEWRLFGIYYDDDRGLVKSDNRSAAARNLDREKIALSTIGFNWVQAVPAGENGVVDILFWGALQYGDWGTLDQFSTAFAFETGYRFTGLPGKPWIRVGVFDGSGDDDPNDDRHETFFQVLPTPRLYARMPIYNMMNSTDMFVQFFAEPGEKWTIRGDYHGIGLNKSTDLWYAGGGAFRSDNFGYAGRPSGGADNLLSVVDLSVDYKLNSHLSTTLYLSHAQGGAVIDNIYDGDTAQFFYLEMTAKF
ncbi:MAG: alginate export family protein [Acidobacteria bacterium]|nr:alginate export family protein [Acidobacteriota bacterium]